MHLPQYISYCLLPMLSSMVFELVSNVYEFHMIIPTVIGTPFLLTSAVMTCWMVLITFNGCHFALKM